MNAEIVRTTTDDGLRLDGILFEPKNLQRKVAVLHCHGLAGNFYGNPFINYFAEELNTKEIAFLSFNNRGHDCLSEFSKKTSNSSEDILCGNSHEIFEECLLDITAWIDFICEKGYTEIVLQGHSSGASKISFYQHINQDSRVVGLILISPPDTLGLQEKEWRGQWQENVSIAQNMIAQNKGRDLMPEGVFHYPISAISYLSYVGPDTKAGVFNFYKDNDPFTVMNSIKIPILGIIGTVDEAIVNDSNECMAILKSKTVSALLCDTNVMIGASHSYASKERELASLIAEWVPKILETIKTK